MVLHFYLLHFPIDELKRTFFGLNKDPCLNEKLSIRKGICFTGRFEASHMEFVFAELNHQPITNPKSEKSKLGGSPRANFKCAFMEVQTIVSILLSSESSS